jgi:hypothetical protein
MEAKSNRERLWGSGFETGSTPGRVGDFLLGVE